MSTASNITSYDLYDAKHSNLFSENIYSIVAKLNKIPTVTTVNLDYNNLNDDNILDQLKFVQTLILSRNDVGDDTARALAKSTTLLYLDVVATNISNEGMAILAASKIKTIVTDALRPRKAEQLANSGFIISGKTMRGHPQYIRVLPDSE